MRMGWRTKVVLLFVVYFAGFATAVYCLGPTPEPIPGEPLQVTGAEAVIRSQDLARSVNSGVHKCIGFGREAAKCTAGLIREKLDKAKSPSDG